MKTQSEIESARSNVDEFAPTSYSGMTYEQGISEALGWVLEDVSDEDFEYAEKTI